MASEAMATRVIAVRGVLGAGRGWMFAVLALAVAAIAWLSVHRYFALERELTEVNLARRTAMAELGASVLSEKFSRVIDLGVSLATRVRFQELVAAERWTEAVQIMRRVPEEFGFIDRVFLADPAGTLTADTPELPGVRGMSFAHRDWYRGVSREWKPYISHTYTRAAVPQRTVIAVAAPIRALDGRVAGILVLQIRLEAFFDWAQRIDLGAEDRVLVLDSAGTAAFDSLPREGAGAALPATWKRAPSSGAELVSDPDSGEELVHAYAPSTYGWSMHIVQPARLVLRARDALLSQLLTDGLLVALCGIAALVFGTLAVVQAQRAASDQAHRAELEQKVRDRTSELEIANRELESFSYSVSHDLRAPLRAIDGYGLMLEEDYAGRLDHEGRRLLGAVRESSKQMARLIDDLLAFSQVGRKEIGRAPVDMGALVREVLAEAVPRGSSARIEVGELPPADCDRALLRQVWTNLIGNALKYSSKRAEPRIEIGGATEGRERVYWVRDNGSGFDMRYYGKLFGVFQRLHRAEEFEGTGVGLAIVQRIVVRHGGRVWAEGAVDAGACFRFSVPVES